MEFLSVMGRPHRITEETSAMGGNQRQRISCPMLIRVMTTSIHWKINEIACPPEIDDVFRMTYFCRLARALDAWKIQVTPCYVNVEGKLQL